MALYSGFVPISNKGQVCSQVTTSKSKGKELHLQKKLNMVGIYMVLGQTLNLSGL